LSTVLAPSELEVGAAARHGGPVAAHHVVEGIARAADLLAILVTGIATYAAQTGSLGPSKDSWIALVVAVLLGANVLAAFRLYEPSRLASLTIQLPRVAAAWAITLGGVLAAAFLLGTGELSRVWVLAWLAAGTVALAAVRFALKSWIEAVRRTGELTRNVLVIGTAAETRAFVDELARHDRTTQVVGRLDLGALVGVDGDSLHGGGELGPESLRQLRRALLGRRIDHVALAVPAEHAPALPALVRALRPFPVEVGLVPQLLCAELPVLGVQQLGGAPSVLLLKKPIEGWGWVVKAIEDRVLAGAILLFIAPLMLCIAMAVRLTSPGPVLFRQKRLGFNQQMVDVFKFRTMYVDLCDAPLAASFRQATRDDPRVTPVGRFLRRTSLDELPQLLNVLRGDMSLVGPRPHPVALDRHYAELIDGYLGRHRVKPGITGWAQVNGFRGETRTVEEMRRRIEHDLHYIDNWSLLFDLRIFVRTLFVGFAGSKAY
jgi:putative colanic acid biosynthesis UDP-glucose lipid carrier transferase